MPTFKLELESNIGMWSHPYGAPRLLEAESLDEARILAQAILADLRKRNERDNVAIHSLKEDA